MLMLDLLACPSEFEHCGHLKETSKHTYWVRRQSKGIPNGFKKAAPTHEPAAAWWIFEALSFFTPLHSSLSFKVPVGE